MLDVQTGCSGTSTSTMSRKRTRSRSEENLLASNSHVNMSFCDPAPFSDDPEPARIRDESGPKPIRIYVDGAFDMFHNGHMRHLLQAKQMFRNVHLIVGVFSDATLQSKLKSLSVLEEDERYGAVRHCKYADEVIRDAPWRIEDRFLFEHKIDFVAHDPEISTSGSGGARHETDQRLRRRGMFLETERSAETVSTSNILARIVRDYDGFVRRNLARGYSAKELNISYLNEKKIRLQSKMHAIKDDVLSKWEEKSRDLVDNFLLLFKKNNLRRIWNGSKRRLIEAISPPSSRDPSPSRSGDQQEAPRKRRRLH